MKVDAERFLHRELRLPPRRSCPRASRAHVLVLRDNHPSAAWTMNGIRPRRGLRLPADSSPEQAHVPSGRGQFEDRSCSSPSSRTNSSVETTVVVDVPASEVTACWHSRSRARGRSVPGWGEAGPTTLRGRSSTRRTRSRDVTYPSLTDADDDELRQTSNAQLATFVLSLVTLDAIERVGLAPTVCAGHSLGEYSALAASGAMTFEDGVRLVAERGEAMADAAEQSPGTMAAVLGLEDSEAEAACADIDGVWIANYNSPGQVVIAGTHEGVAEASAVAASTEPGK